jgi:hypothetical protein
MGGKAKAPATVSQSAPQYSPEQQALFRQERGLLQGTILPAERERMDALSALIGGRFDQAGSILSPALSAARQGQNRLRAITSDLPSWVSAPLLADAAWAEKGIPRQLQAGATDELAKMTQQLIAPQFGQLLHSPTGQTGTTTGGGSSKLQTGLAVGTTVAAVAAVAIAI